MRGLYALKPWYGRRLARIVDLAVRHRLSPDVFTAAGVCGAVLAAVSTAVGWWPLVLIFLAVRLAGANLDGAVARARAVSRPWGFVVNELGDRSSDLIMFAGLVGLAARSPESGRTAVLLALVAAVAATLPTFVSLASLGAGVTRRNGGPFGKTERCLAVVVATAFPAALGWVCAAIIVGSVVTAAVRLLAAHHEVRAAVAS